MRSVKRLNKKKKGNRRELRKKSKEKRD